jgi:kynureninase
MKETSQDRGATTDDLLEWRKEFPILEKTVYMISNSLGAMPRGVYDRMREFAEMWATRGVRAWADGWWEMPVTVGNRIARILGAPDGSVTMHQNVAIAEQVVLSCFEFRPGRDKVVYSALNFPSVMYVYEAQRRRGARVETVPSDDGITVPTERMLAAIDETTLLVPVSQVLFKSAYIQDARAICRRAREVGAHVVLDVYQGAGTVPIDVGDLDVDFVVGGSVKWLCGGPGAGYLYVNPRLAPKLEPAMTGWMAHAAPFAFEPAPVRYAEAPFRFLNGSPHVPALYSATSGYDIILEIGVERIRKKSVRQIARLIDLAAERGWRVAAPPDPERRGGTVAIDVPHGLAVAKELIRREFLVDFRPGAGIRVSPHFYTKDEEIDLTLREIATILETKAYAKHLEAERTSF